MFDEAAVLDPPDVDGAHDEGPALRGVAEQVARVGAFVAMAIDHAGSVGRDKDGLCGRDTAAIGSLLTPVNDFVCGDLLQWESWSMWSPRQFGSGRLEAPRSHEQSRTWDVASKGLYFPRTLMCVANKVVDCKQSR